MVGRLGSSNGLAMWQIRMEWQTFGFRNWLNSFITVLYEEISLWFHFSWEHRVDPTSKENTSQLELFVVLIRLFSDCFWLIFVLDTPFVSDIERIKRRWLFTFSEFLVTGWRLEASSRICFLSRPGLRLHDRAFSNQNCPASLCNNTVFYNVRRRRSCTPLFLFHYVKRIHWHGISWLLVFVLLWFLINKNIF